MRDVDHENLAENYAAMAEAAAPGGDPKFQRVLRKIERAARKGKMSITLYVSTNTWLSVHSVYSHKRPEYINQLLATGFRIETLVSFLEKIQIYW